MAKLYEESRQDLSRELEKLVARGRDKSLEAHNIRQILAQVNDGVKDLQKKIYTNLKENNPISGKLGQNHVVSEIKAMESRFVGRPTPLKVEQVAVFQKVLNKSSPSLLNRYQKSSELYGKPVISNIRDQLSLSLLQEEPMEVVVDRVVGTDGIFENARWRAERIVRTEMAFGYNTVKFNAYKEVRGQLPDLKKTLISIFDDRTGLDSWEQHMQIRDLEEPFEYHVLNGKGIRTGQVIYYQYPPNRPNDRAEMTTWRDGYTGDPDTEIASPAPDESEEDE